MHPSAMSNARHFFNAYAASFDFKPKRKIIEIGSQDVNGSLRSVAPPGFDYIGVDFVEGKGVDIILDDPYALPFDDESADIILSNSCFEHSEMFWLVFLEVMRILKPGGLLYLNVPSNGVFHRFPVDCWRFYPDSGRALVSWAKRNGISAALLESYVSHMEGADQGFDWNDFVAVFLKDETLVANFPKRILDSKHDFDNGILFGYDNNQFLNITQLTGYQKQLAAIKQIASGEIQIA